MARIVDIILAVLALAAIGLSVERLLAPRADVSIERVAIEGTPARVFSPPAARADDPRPAVVVAHGFAGSQQLMEPFAVALARNGYVAVTFDFLGHGRNPRPLTGDVTAVEGATRALVRETGKVADYAAALPETDGRLAVLGHSMASDIVVRVANERADVEATIAVSMFSPAVTATAPPNLLVIVGAWEGALIEEAIRAVGLATQEPPEPGVTYGDFADGTARRIAVSPSVEHIAVLYSEASLSEAVGWLDAAFGRDRAAPPETSGRLGWIGLLVLGIVVLARPLSRLLPVVSPVPRGAGLPWRSLWPVILVPALVTPVALVFVPTDFLPVSVGDYLAVHFLAYGLLTAATAAWAVRRHAREAGPEDEGAPAVSGAGSAAGAAATGRTATAGMRRGAFALATLATTVYAIGALGLAIDTFFTSFYPTPARLPIVGAMLAGTLAYFLATEWATHGAGAGRAAYPAAKAAFVVSLGIATALDFERLFFLLIIVPVVILFFVIFGLFSRWAYARTNHPAVGAIANAVSFAVAIGVTFPMLAG